MTLQSDALGDNVVYGTCQDAMNRVVSVFNLRDTFPDLWDDTEGVIKHIYENHCSDPTPAVGSCYTGNRFDQWVPGAQKAGNHDDGKCLYFQRDAVNFPLEISIDFNRFDGHQLKSCWDNGYRTHLGCHG